MSTAIMKQPVYDLIDNVSAIRLGLVQELNTNNILEESAYRELEVNIWIIIK